MKPSGPAAFRLQFSQSWNGVASFCGPFIASKYFFTGKNASNLTNVQFVYMAVSGLGIVMALAFAFTRLPEVSEEDLQAEADALAEATGGHDDEQLAKPFWKREQQFLLSMRLVLILSLQRSALFSASSASSCMLVRKSPLDPSPLTVSTCLLSSHAFK